MNSRLFEGTVRHVRRTPERHAFDYRISYFYLDLDELPAAMEHGVLCSARHAALIRFNRSDYLCQHPGSLRDAVKDLVRERTGADCSGPVRLLTQPRYVGYGFNPVSFYYVFDKHDEALEFVVAEITNTPWGERHCYVLDCRYETQGNMFRFEFDKRFHVSPFMGMAQRYEWSLSAPGESLTINMLTMEAGLSIFAATMSLDARPLTTMSIASAAARIPLTTMRITAGIYWNALLLKLKGVPFHKHPNNGDQREMKH